VFIRERSYERENRVAEQCAQHGRAKGSGRLA
jgi:hypothetical protein